MSKKIKQTIAGGKSDITAAFLSLEGALRQFLMRFFVRPQDIEDAIQETFIRAYEAGKKQEIRSPRSFIFKIAENLALSELGRKANQLLEYMGDIEELEVLDNQRPSIMDEMIQEEKLALYSKEVASLPQQCQRVVIMRKVFGFSHKEIAAQMNISVKTVENHLTKGLQRCQEAFSMSGMQAGPHSQDRQAGE